jgi:hypothetical protein
LTSVEVAKPGSRGVDDHLRTVDAPVIKSILP